MHASKANLEALYYIELGVEASGQCGSKGAGALLTLKYYGKQQ